MPAFDSGGGAGYHRSLGWNILNASPDHAAFFVVVTMRRLHRIANQILGAAFVAALALALASPSCAADAALPFDVPAGFSVARVADDALAHDIFSITCDGQGRPVVSGPGYIRRLIDADGDGRAESAQQISALPASGAQGMCFDGPYLWFTGDGMFGRLTDADGDGAADGPPESFAKLRPPEHGAHAVVKGPDGWLYVLCGNDAGVTKEHVTSPASPVAEPLSGAVLRFTPDGKQCQALAHGFRNPYDIDFTPAGGLLTVDSDGERAHHLPWYTPTRLFDVAVGGHHGWLERGWTVSWSRPEWFSDNVPRAAELGRGSPSGLTVYRHRQFPERYRGGAFSACWTLGRIFFLPLEVEGSQLRSKPEVFFSTTGSVGFAPVDLVVNPEGDLLVAIGGRRTSGGVFRIRYEAGHPVAAATSESTWLDAPERAELKQVLLADQRLEGWSREQWSRVATKVRQAPLASAAAKAELPTAQRIAAIETLTELFGGINEKLAAALVEDESAAVRARLAWSLPYSAKNPTAMETLFSLTADAEPTVVRAAWEALLTVEPVKIADPTPAAWLTAGESADRRIRQLALAAARRFKPTETAALFQSEGESAGPRLVMTQLWASDPLAGRAGARDAAWVKLCFERALTILEKDADAGDRLEAVRLLQLALGDVRAGGSPKPEHEEGYTGRSAAEVDEALRQQAAKVLADLFPSGHAALDTELSRLAGMLETSQPDFLIKLATRWTADSSPADDVHYLIVASRLVGARTPEFTAATATAVANLHAKLRAQKLHLSRTWPFHVGQTFAALCQLDPALPAGLAEHRQFGLPDHSLFAARMSGAPAETAAQRLLETCQKTELAATDYDDELIAVLGKIPDGAALPHLRKLFDDGVGREAITGILAREPQADDRARFVAALDLLPAETVRLSAKSLAVLPEPGSGDEITATIRALRRFAAALPRSAGADAPAEAETRRMVQQFRPTIDTLAYLLVSWTGGSAERRVPEDAPVEQVVALCDRWYAWFAKRYPDQASRVAGLGASGFSAWQDRVREIRWDAGDAARGKAVYEKQSCHRCHAGNSRLGPELTGVAGRLSREDLLAAIVDPSREVSPLYRTKLLATRSGQVYHGLVVYESPEGTIMQTGVETTVRVGAEDFLELADSTQSLMPTGLLESASNEEVADLMAYLATLAPPAVEQAAATAP